MAGTAFLPLTVSEVISAGLTSVICVTFPPIPARFSSSPVLNDIWFVTVMGHLAFAL